MAVDDTAPCRWAHGPSIGNEHHTPALRLALCHAAAARGAQGALTRVAIRHLVPQ
jgi:hypothetical protein